MADVFISYKKEERARVERIAEKLRGLGLDVWFDVRLQTGTEFPVEIQKAVTASKAVLVLWSRASSKSSWVQNEARRGMKASKLVAATLEEIPPNELPVEFDSVHYEQLHNPRFQDDDPAWLKIVERIGQLTDRPQILSFSQALARAALPLEEWARQNPSDKLAISMREKANLLGGETPKAAVSQARAWKAATLITIGVLGVALGAGVGGYGVWSFMPRAEAEPVAPPPPIVERSLQEQAAALVGRYSLDDKPACADPVMVAEVWLGHTPTSTPVLWIRNGNNPDLAMDQLTTTEGEWLVGVNGATRNRYRRDSTGLVTEGNPDTWEACTPHD